jgi:hypothetical protein
MPVMIRPGEHSGGVCPSVFLKLDRRTDEGTDGQHLVGPRGQSSNNLIFCQIVDAFALEFGLARLRIAVREAGDLAMDRPAPFFNQMTVWQKVVAESSSSS